MIRNLLTNQATISFRTSGQPISEQLPRHECTSATLKGDDAGHASGKRGGIEDTTQAGKHSSANVTCRRLVGGWRTGGIRGVRAITVNELKASRPARRQPMDPGDARTGACRSLSVSPLRHVAQVRRQPAPPPPGPRRYSPLASEARHAWDGIVSSWDAGHAAGRDPAATATGSLDECAVRKESVGLCRAAGDGKAHGSLGRTRRFSISAWTWFSSPILP